MNSFLLTILGLVCSIALNAIAQVFLRSGAVELTVKPNFIFFLELIKSVHIWYGMMCYAISILLWIMVLSKVQVSLAYPFQGLGYIFGTLLAWFFLNERISILNITGLFIILLGIIVLSIGIYNNEQ